MDDIALHPPSSSNGSSPELAPAGYEGDLPIKPVGPADFDDATLHRMYRTMLLSRRLDEKMLMLLRQGKGNFHIGASGHEAAQAAIGLHFRPGFDWTSAYYRDLTMALMAGVSVENVLLHHLSKATDPYSGGRQMPEHFSDPERHLFVPASAVGAQFLPGIGLAMNVRRRGEDAFVYVSGGEGSTSQGAFHEALNWSAKDRLPVLFHIQDNKYAISVTSSEQTCGGTIYTVAQGLDPLVRFRVDGTDFFRAYAVAQAAVDYVRRGEGPALVVSEVVRLLPHSSSDNHAKYRSRQELERDRKRDPITRFELRLIEEGVFTSEQVEEMRAEVRQTVDRAAREALRAPDPDPATVERHLFFEGTLDIAYEQEGPVGEDVVMVDAINHALHEEMARDERVLVYGEDVAGKKGGVFSATRGLTDAFGADRCYNAPLAENAIIGSAVGLAASGWRPVVEIQFGDYIWPAMQQLRNVVPSVRYRSNGRWGAPLVVRVPVGGYIHGGPYHSQNIEAIFAHTPGWKIAYPSTAADAKALLKTAIRMQDPVLFLEHKGLYRQPAARSPEPGADYLLPFGKARVVRSGGDLTIVTYGAMVYKSMNAARELAKAGFSVEIVDLRTIVPLDMDTVLASLRKTNRALVVYEDQKFVGFGAEISALLMETAFTWLDAPVRRVAARHVPVPFAPDLETAVLPSDRDIIDAALETVRF